MQITSQLHALKQPSAKNFILIATAVLIILGAFVVSKYQNDANVAQQQQVATLNKAIMTLQHLYKTHLLHMRVIGKSLFLEHSELVQHGRQVKQHLYKITLRQLTFLAETFFQNMLNTKRQELILMTRKFNSRSLIRS